MIDSHLLDPASAGVALTICAYVAALALHRRAGLGHLVNPTILTIVLVAGILAVTGLPYTAYMRGGSFIQFMLSFAAVLLAVPLVEDGRRLLKALPVLGVALLIALPFGGAVGAAAAMASGADLELVHSLLTRTVTAGVSATTAERLGGIAPLAGLTALLTGVATATLGPPLLKALGVRSSAALGLTLGAHGHAIGSHQAGLIRPDALPYARLAMAASTVVGAILLPHLQTVERRMMSPETTPIAAVWVDVPAGPMPKPGTTARSGAEHMPWITGSGITWASGSPMTVRPDARMLAWLR